MKTAKYSALSLACVLALSACNSSNDDDPVDPGPGPGPDPSPETATLYSNGQAISGASLQIGSSEDYGMSNLEVGSSFSDGGLSAEQGGGFDNGEETEHSWMVSTTGAQDEAYLVVQHASGMDLNEYADGALRIQLKVDLAIDDGGESLIAMQTDGGASPWLDRNNFFFPQSALTALEGEGWQTLYLPLSCFEADEAGAFDLSKVNQLLRLDMRDGATDYELAGVYLDMQASLPEGAVNLCDSDEPGEPGEPDEPSLPGDILYADGAAATGLELKAGSEPSWNEDALVNAGSTINNSNMTVSANTDADGNVVSWSVNSTTTEQSYLFIYSDTPLDMSTSSDSVILLDMEIAAASGSDSNLLALQTDEWNSRKPLYFSNDLFATQAGQGRKVFAAPLSCFNDADADFDISSVKRPVHLDTRGGTAQYTFHGASIAAAAEVPSDAIALCN
ncbi:putative glycoside hydrolase [Aliagarivorans taiwanensis]|uniref:putative glycoside hydrolase n=1 Tax=Aliagarivorans taiwanensis TaxID=561966 RepID=UPI00041EA7E3|nr:putative glycoside hydrolase [Aliagarivorans taiwanensis]